MPPPTASDSWLAARRFGVVIDAGSSGSRLQIYSWKDVRTNQGDQASDSLPRVERGTQHSEEWSVKVEPGISSFAENPEGVASYLAPLLEHARSHIPPSLQSETPLFLLATAGMRLLSPIQQAEVLRATCHFLKFHSNFRIDDASPLGPCGSSVRIIAGEEEGLFGWIAVNYLMDGFSNSGQGRPTYGFLDMGGASTQIAFEPSKTEQDKAQNLIDVRLRLLDGQEIHHKVFVTTWLGYGTNQARERYVEAAVNNHEADRTSRHAISSSPEEVVLDPCLPKDLKLMEPLIQAESLSSYPKLSRTLLGTGSFERCLERTLPLLNKDAPCPDTQCLFNGVHVPTIDFSASHFIGISEYWYSSEHVFGLGGPYDVVQYERAASEFCARPWSDIVRQHEESRRLERPGGDAEVDHSGQTTDTGRWSDKVEIPRLQMQCFKAAWIVNVLHEGLRMPRIVDPGGNNTAGSNQVAQHAENKGLGRPTFQSMESVGDIAISWTLGKMVLEASKEVRPLSTSEGPLVDPLGDISNVDSPIKPVRPPFFDFDAIEDHISYHLPSSFTRDSLGFSPVAFLFYSVMILVLLVVAHRLKHRVRSAIRRLMIKRDRGHTSEGYWLEEGQRFNGGVYSSPRSASPSRLPPRTFRPFRQLMTSLGLHSSRPPFINLNNSITPPRSGQSSPTHRAPVRSFSFPLSTSQNGLSASEVFNAMGPSCNTPGSPRLYDASIVSNGSASSLSSRSRNSSQMNLSSLTPRQTISRTSSSSHTPIGTLFLEE
ncbi:hypothetical protein AcW1_006246 [Taiwanofungus camphoratus]|nr:hypothetical protein AcV7_008502 [Antrodia cinnamomea]KAI0958063.1 hypothetical protein AcW1_006246 [Antrodia cinnamomea]